MLSPKLVPEFACIHPTKFAVEVPAYKRRLDSKIEVNCTRHFRDTRDQSFSFCSSFFSSPTLSFRTNHKIGSNSQVYNLIQLKFGILVPCVLILAVFVLSVVGHVNCNAYENSCENASTRAFSLAL